MKRSSFLLYFSRLPFLVASTSILVSLTSSMLLLLSFILRAVAVDASLLVAAFTLTFAVYNLDRIVKPKEDIINDPQRSSLYRMGGKFWGMLSAAALTASLALGMRRGLVFLLTLLLPVLVFVGYGVGFRSLPRLKDIPGVKNVVLVGMWALIPTLLSGLCGRSMVGEGCLLLSVMIFSFIFLKIMVNSILFDVRDVKGDRAAGVRTLPVILGVKRTRRLLLLLNASLILWIVLCWVRGLFHPYLPLLAGNVLYGFWYIHFFTRNPNRNRVYLDMLVDGEWIPLTLLVMLVHYAGFLSL